MSHVNNAAISGFITDYVNLPAEREKKYRKQVTYLRDRFGAFAADHPDLQVVKLLASGSLKKRTHNAKLNDIDIAAYVDCGPVTANNIHLVDSTKLLDDVCSTLRQVYGATKDHRDFEVRSTAVAIHFHGSGLDVDVVPVVIDPLSADDEGWVLRGGSPPLRTSIPRHGKFIKSIEDAYPGFRPFVRLLKWWRTTNGVEVRSFVLELLAAHLARDEVIVPNRPLEAFEAFVDWIAETQLDVDIWFNDWHRDDGAARTTPFVMDPVNPSNNAAEKLQEVWGPSQRLEDLVGAADEAAAWMSEAVAARTRTQARDALARVFGPSVKAVIE